MFYLQSVRSMYCRIISALVFLLFLFSATTASAQGNPITTGSGYCLNFTANLGTGYVDLGSLAALDTGNFSIEMWVNVNACKGDPAFFSNKDWSSGNNPGMVFDVHDNGKRLRINLKAGNSTFQNIILPINAIGRGWFHLAVTLDRNTYLKIYIDGILKSSTYLDKGLVGSFTSPYTYKLGQDGTGAYSDDNGVPIPYDGKLDELRIWKTERTEDEIKENMCRKISPLSPNLYAYYTFDASSGDTVKDLKNTNSGKWVKGVAGSWKVSGAPIGDTSVQLYPESGDWDNKELLLTDALFGSMKIKNVQAVEGVQLYKVNGKPNSVKGLNTFSDNGIYYGVYLAGITTSTTYDASLDYSTYPKALADENNLKLFVRNQNSDQTWSEYLGTTDVTKKTVTKQGVKKRREYLLGTKTGTSCAASTAFTIGTQTDTSCVIGWTSAASQWNTEWGTEGFELGTGHAKQNTSSNPQTATGLQHGSFYEFYVQDKCSTSSESYWVGPFLFYPQSCLSPSNFLASKITDKSVLLTWKGNGYKSDVEWGLLGFTLGQGIPDSTFTDSLLLTGLAANTTYAYYVKTNCPAGSNNFNGPFTFKTLDKIGVDENELLHNLSIYPNPGDGIVTVLVNTPAKKIDIRIYNVLGEEMIRAGEINKNGSIKQTFDLHDLHKGMYFIRITDGVQSATKSLIIQ